MSLWDKLKGVYLGLAAVGLGLFFYFGPAEMVAEIDEETPWRREISIGMMALGGLVWLALIFTRAKALLIALLTGVVAAGCLFAAIGGGLSSLEAVGLGAVGVLSGVFALYSLSAVITGHDPAGDDFDNDRKR